MFVSAIDLLAVAVLLSVCHGSDEERALRMRVLNRVDKGALPVPQSNETLTVKYSLSLQSMPHFSHDDMVATFIVWEVMTWQDPLLAWDPEFYHNIKNIRIDTDKLWTPDITLFNNVEPQVERSSAKVLVTHDGTVLYVPQTRYTLPCALKSVTIFSHDLLCRLQIGSWTYDETKLDLQLIDEGFDGSRFFSHPSWSMNTASVKRHVSRYPMWPERFVDVTYDLQFSPVPNLD